MYQVFVVLKPVFNALKGIAKSGDASSPCPERFFFLGRVKWLRDGVLNVKLVMEACQSCVN
jgi:hypothetical protein